MFIRALSRILIISMFASTQLQASLVEESSDSNTPKQSSEHRLWVPADVAYRICDRLSPRDWGALACTSRNVTSVIRGYEADFLRRLPGRFDEDQLSSDQIDYILSKYVKNNEELRQSFVKGLATRMEKDHFLLAPTGSPVIPYLRNEFAPLELQHFIDHLDSTSRLYTALFKSTLPTDHESLKITAIKHLQVILPVYVPKDPDLKQQGAQQFFQQKIDTILKVLDLKRSLYPYFSFLSPEADFQDLQNQAYNIVVTDEQLQNANTKTKLSELFHANPNHTLILSIGDSTFVNNGCLSLRANDLPASVKHLCVRNPSGNVTSIGREFLFGCTGLTAFDISGFKQLVSIGNGFLSDCKGLTAFDASGLTQVISIGHGFLSDCKGLTAFDASGLTQVISIGYGFLFKCKGLTAFDTSWLKQVISIGHCFLSDCEGLTAFDTSWLKQVISIGDDFLFGCTGLTAFDTSGLIQVKSIGREFLFGCTGLTTFGASGLTQVTSIGDSFLAYCIGLTAFDTSWLKQVITIGDNFLFRCAGLTAFDISGLTQVTSIGNYFLYGCTSLNAEDKRNIEIFVEKKNKNRKI